MLSLHCGHGKPPTKAMNILTQALTHGKVAPWIKDRPRTGSCSATLTRPTHWGSSALFLWLKGDCYGEVSLLCAMGKKGIEDAPYVSHRIQVSLLALNLPSITLPLDYT